MATLVHCIQNQVAKNPEVKAAVLISKKPDNFIAGADIRMIDATEDKSTLKNSECDCDKKNPSLFSR